MSGVGFEEFKLKNPEFKLKNPKLLQQKPEEPEPTSPDQSGEEDVSDEAQLGSDGPDLDDVSDVSDEAQLGSEAQAGPGFTGKN